MDGQASQARTSATNNDRGGNWAGRRGGSGGGALGLLWDFATLTQMWMIKILFIFSFFFFLENPLGRRFDFYLNRASTQCKHFVIVGSVSFSIVSDSLGPMDCSLPGSVMELIHEILQARVLEWVAITFSRGSSQPRGWTHACWVSDSLPLSHLGSLISNLGRHL